jgi:hypothetical protein
MEPMMDAKTINFADKIYQEAFTSRFREPRSTEYKAGVLAALRDKVSQANGSADRNEPPYMPGTTQFDAWVAGYQEGLLLWEMQ